MKKTHLRLARLVGTSAAMWLVGCGEAPPPPEEPVRPVCVIRVADPAEKRMRSFAGTVRPALESEISFRVPGKIVELPVKPGMEVRRGDLLARLDPADYELQQKQAESQLRQAETMLQQAQNEARRVRQLYEANVVSRSELDQALTALQSAEAQRDGARRAVELARLQKEYTELRAPFDGRVVARPAEVHSTVAAGQPIVTLAAGEKLEFVIGVPEALIAHVQMGAPAQVTFDAVPGKTFSAEVVEIGAEMSARGTYPIRLALGGDTRELRLGMTGEATLAFPVGAGEGIRVPAECVVARPDGSHFVWIVPPETNVVEERTVKIGALTSEGLQILEGLQAGEQVVVRGMHRLQPGTRVRPMDCADETKDGS